MMTDEFRLVVLTPMQLAHFAKPRTWSEIFALEPRMSRSRWRFGVLEADEHGRGFLKWTPAPRTKGDRRRQACSKGTWELTESGLAFVFQRLGTTGIH